MVMLSLPRIYDDAPVAYKTPPSWCTAEGAVLFLTREATDPVWYGGLISSHGESRAKYNLTEPIPLQVKHVAVELIVESFRPSGPFLLTMKISAQWCRVDTSCFTHKWETRGGRKRLIPFRTNPRDLPTARGIWIGSKNMTCDMMTCEMLVSYSFGALSAVNHKGLHQRWTKTSLYLQVIYFTSHHTTSHVFCCCCCLAYLYSAGAQHGNLHQAEWPILFCGPARELVLTTANTWKNQERFWKQMQVNGPEGQK